MIALAPVSGLYGLAMKTRRAFYRSGIFATHELGAPVISVGNLTTGGTGKTPLVEWIARELAKRQRRVCILTRGYGRANEKDRVLVADGKRILSTPVLAGDEPFLLAEKLLNKAAIISAADRTSAARWAVDNLKSDVFLLDDGFQNLRIARSLDIVTIDAMNPWGNRWLLPAGRLREPVAELARADCIVITRADDKNRGERLQSKIAKFTHKPVLLSRMMVSDVRPTQTSSTGMSQPLKATPVAVFCGIGNSTAFFCQLRNAGYNVVHTEAFRDHHIYKQADINRLSRESIAKGAKVVLTTAKDEVKLRALNFELPCYVVDITIEIEDDDKLNEMIDDALREGPGQSQE